MVGQYGITVVPLNFYLDGKIYRDWVDITPAEAYELFLKDPESFKAAPPSPGDFLEAYRKVSKQANSIFHITTSSRISSTYYVALKVKEQITAEFPQTTVEVLDSQQVAAAEGFVALAAARAAAEGKSLAEVVKVAEETRDKVNFFVFLETIRHVYRSGRIPKVASQAGSILNIKPILTTSSGVLHFIGVTRSKKTGAERLLKIMRNKVGLRPVHVAITHAYALDEAKKLKEQISSEFNCAELWISEFSPLMGYACGTGTLGIAFYSDD